MKVPKVLIFTPTYSGKDYCTKRFLDNISLINYPNHEFLLIDNSEGLEYYEHLKTLTDDVVHIPRGKNGRESLAAAQNYARQYAVKEGFDYVLSVEIDLFPPANIIQHLMKHFKPVVGALYYLGGFEHKGKMIEKIPCVYVTSDEGTRPVTEEEHTKLQSVDGPHKVFGIGMGCSLIDINVFKKYPFWCDSRFTHKQSDVFFHMDLWNDSVPVFIDYSVEVDHDPKGFNTL